MNTAEGVGNDPVITFIAIFALVILAVAIWAGISLARQRWQAYLAGAQAEIDAAVNHTDDCPRCAPARARLQQLDPLHGMTEGDFLEAVRNRQPLPDVDDAGRWVRA